MDYKNYNPRQAALTEARALLIDAAKAAVPGGRTFRDGGPDDLGSF